ncbi:MAG: hypothetical protein ACRD9S_10890 [Pyrinomonadaceae bacterium]
MDETTLRKALATLKSFADNLPKGAWIEEKYITLYHSILTDIERETSHNLDYFRVPASEVRTRKSGGSENIETGEWTQRYTSHAQCDRDIFLIKFNGAVNFIASFLDATGKRIIGFAP